MPPLKPLRLLSSCILFCTLAACGGGGDSSSDGGSGSSGSGSAPLSTGSDVLQQVSVLSAAVSAISQVSDSAGTAAPSSAAPSQAKLLRLAATPKSMVQTAPKADTTCDSGTAAPSSIAFKSYTFSYVGGQAANVGYENITFAGCKRSRTENGATYTVTLDGAAEGGQTLQSVNGADYAYLVAGSGSTALQAVIAVTSETLVATPTVTLKILGTSQTQSTSTTEKSGSLLTLDFAASAAGTTPASSGTFDLGDASKGTPFTVTTNKSTSAYELNGPYSYVSTQCAGGAASVATTADLTTAEDSTTSQNYINGGAFTITTSGASGTVTFASDGGATYTLSNGMTGTLTRDQIESPSGSCGFATS